MIDLKRFQAKTLAHTKKAALTTKEDRHFGCPTSWLLRVLPVVKSGKQLAVAIYVWKRYVVRGHRGTFDMPNGGLKQLGISRHTKYRALALLANAGIITMKRIGKETFLLTILPEKPRPRTAGVKTQATAKRRKTR